jgi:acyl dehydratase
MDNAPFTYEVMANNLSRASENKIHDDTVARRFGFSGGLVPGVEVYAYAVHPAVRRWGRAWLERGSADCRFLKPVYDGCLAVVTAEPQGEERLALRVQSQGVPCATGEAALDRSAAGQPSLAAFPEAHPPVSRLPAGEDTLAVGTLLGIAPYRLTEALLAEYLKGVRETEPLYAQEGLAHPGLVLRLCNKALTENVVLGPWIHVGSHVRNFAVARVGDTLTLRARVTGNYERKGHRLVDLDALVLANGETPVARVTHTAVWRPRQVAEAA